MNEASLSIWVGNRKVNITDAVISKFWDRLQNRPKDGCWEWEGKRLPKGYGQLCVSKSCALYPHRVSYILHYGEIPHGMLVCHSCDNPPCCRPDHLFLGTYLDNNLDSLRKGRHAIGDRHPARINPDYIAKGVDCRFAKLTDEKVLEMQKLYASGLTQSILGKMFGVARSNVGLIMAFKTWKHVSRPVGRQLTF